ncbi:MAG: hypothetical protein CM15mV25_1720 [uncultured marine virus]|nr:MAG: hypothetical protein CM15mV25_1720 [uncultured marine virus]
MITLNDIERITTDKAERLINNAVKANKMARQIGLRTFGMVYLLNYVRNIIELTYIINIYIRLQTTIFVVYYKYENNKCHVKKENGTRSLQSS